MENFMVSLLLVATLAIVYVTAINDPTKFDTPVIFPSDKEIIVTAGNNYNLTCKGKQPLTWILPENQLSDDESEKAQILIRTSEPTDDDDTYGIFMEMFNLSVVDVGFYYCAYNESEEHKGDTYDKLEAMGLAKSVYLYVEDPDALLVPSDSMIGGIQFQNLTIPCKPTSPNVDVKLFREENEVTDYLKFDPHTGFLIRVNNLAENEFKCIFSNGAIQVEHQVFLYLNSFISSIPKPFINDSFNGRSVVEGVIKLECTIRLSPGTPFDIEWLHNDYRITDKKDNRFDISKTTTNFTNVVDSNIQRIGKSFLTVRNVKEEDGGEYTCRVLAHNNNVTNKVTKKIGVLSKGSSLIYLSEATNKSLLFSKTGKPLDIIVNIDSFPEPTITWYDNKNRKIFLSTKYDIKGTNNETHLKIKNITLEDRGIYQVKGQSGNATATLNFTLVVNSPPEITLYTEQYYIYNIKHNITCNVRGNPIPKIKWYIKECEDENCNSELKEINKFDYIPVDDVTARATIQINIWKSAYLYCAAENKFGKFNKSSMVFGTDVENGFGVVNSHSSIVDGDNVTLTCSASKYRYPSETLNWYKLPDNILLNEERNFDHEYYRHSTNYSNKFTLTFKNITRVKNGEYECRVEQKSFINDILEKKKVELNVTAVEMPVIKDADTSLNGTKIKVELRRMNLNFFCKAKGNPKPQIQWFKDDEPLKIDQRITLSKDGTTVTFTNMLEEDDGIYSCVAENRVGRTQRHIEISIDNGGFNFVYIIVIILLLFLFIILISALCYKIKKEKELQKQLTLMGLRNFDEGEISGLNPELGLDEQAELLPYDKKWEFPQEKLKLGKQLGSGAFGVVMKATAYGILVEEESTTVAVKMVKRTADSTLIKALASELKIMVHLGKHLNVVNLLGACTKNVVKRELYVIVEYCRFGNLHNYLLRHREHFIDQIDHSSGNIDPIIGIEVINRAYSVSSDKSSGLKSAMQPLLRRSSVSKDDSNMNSLALDTNNTVVSMIPTGDDAPITSSGSAQPEWRSNYKGDYNYSKDIRPISTQDLLSWSFQIARGMEYLANRKVLHGDLAARNILLADDNIVKICDFGLAKNMYKNDNYKKKGDSPLPVKWMAIESIRDRVFSTQSDIWSYGIVLWELFSLARTPYPGMEADEKFYNKLVEGYRMEKPKYSNKIIYNVMLECWRARPVQRPTFGELVDKLGNLLEDGVRKHYIDLNDPYMDMNNRWLAERGDNDYLAMMNAPDYGNLTSANPTHEYVNDPFGGPTKVNPLSPDDIDDEGYLRMTPARNGSNSIGSHLFNFPSPTSPKVIKPQVRGNSENGNKNHEWVPMLIVENEAKRPGSDSDIGESLPTSPNQDKSGMTPSFSNPTYQTDLKSAENKTYPENLLIVNDNYTDMSNKDSGFCENIVMNNSIGAFANPSYVSMSSNSHKPFSNHYTNIPPNVMT